MGIDRYKNIINLNRPVSEKHGCMTRLERAKQFAPFAALKGFDRAINYQNRTCIPQAMLSDERMEHINRILQMICTGDVVQITYFRHDGAIQGYGTPITISGQILKINSVDRILNIGGCRIPLEDILDVKVKR